VRFVQLLLVGCLLLATASGAQAAPARGPGAGVSVVACASGNSHAAARQGCEEIPGAGFEGSQSSGLDGVIGLAAIAGSLYAVGNRGSAVAQLAAGSHSLSFAACLTGDKFLDACTQIPGATSNAPEAPISQPTATALSPDGRFLYVVSGDFHGSVIARFARDPLSGALTYLDCLTGDEEAGPAGPGGCALIPSATREGYGSGLYEPSGVAITADGRHLYVTAAGDGSVASFGRDPASGALSFVECLSSNPKASGCARATGGGGRPIFSGIATPLISSDGRYLYATAAEAETVGVFALGAGGKLRLASCLSRRDDARPCRPGSRPTGPVAALSNPGGLAASPDGRFLYASSTYGTLVTLRRDRGSGALSASSCVSSDRADARRCALTPATPRRSRGTHHAALLTGARTPLLRGRAEALVPVRTVDGILRFRRDPRSGALSYRGCFSAQLILSGRRGPCASLPGATRKGPDSGFYKLTALLPAPGGLVYAAASGDATVSLLRP
jgi:6-phosphogluconolactonase (cycloisomerase 2 family)